MIGLSEAKDKVLSFSRSFGEEIRSLDEVQGRVLAEDVLTDRPYPPFNRAAMDGYAIRSEDFMGNSSREFSVLGEIHAGDDIAIDWTIAGDCVKIMTGAPTPLGFDTIIRVEDSVSLGQGKVKFECGTIKLGQNISKMGEDISKGEVLLSKGIELRASELGALAVVGKQRVKVNKMPKLALYSTGNEVRSVGEDVLPHQIRDSNMYSLGSHFLKYCGRPIIQKVLPDKPKDIRVAILEANQADIFVLTGGVSAGDADYIPMVLKELGFTEVFHKVKIKPGKPVWFGVNGSQVVFALPGNPMSCQVGFKLFVEPFLRASLGLSEYPVYRFPIGHYRKKKVGLDEFFPVKINSSGVQEVITNGSGDIRTGIGSVGLAWHPMNVPDLNEGDFVEVLFW